MVVKRKRQSHRDTVEAEEGFSRPETNQNRYTDHALGPEVPSGTVQEVATPPEIRRGRPRGSSKKAKQANGKGSIDGPESPFSPKRNALFSTPIKTSLNVNGETGPPIVRNSDRSARRKSSRTLLEPTAINGLSEEENLEEDDLLARRIWEIEEAESGEEHYEVEDELDVESIGPTTPSKHRRSRRERSPTPPQNLPPLEQYFWQNRPGKVKTSNNTLSSLSLLTHEQYHDRTSAYNDPHQESYDYLHALHSRSFPQWRFEFSQSFNICLYGYGSKRKLVTAFAKYLHSLCPSSPPKILVINGYIQTLTLRTLLTTLATLIFDCTPSTLPSKLGSQPREMLTTILAQLQSKPPDSPYYVFVNSLDAPSLRRSSTPSLLAQLAACPHIHFLATCDTPNFHLLWSTTLRDQYNFLFHDTTTYLSYGGVEIPSVIDSVNEILGRSGRSVKGKEGVGFVLRSLPENARSLYRVLVAELLAAMDDDEGGKEEGGIEYKVLYQKVVEEFICSNEMGFRQLLKEFYDHQMVVSRRDGAGAELLGVPWRREEMEAILEDIV